MAEPPSWLRCLALSYPMLAPLPGMGVDDRFRPVAAVPGARDLPLLLTRVGRESPQIAETVSAFVGAAQAAGVPLEVIDVPDGQHSFDILDHDADSRDAIRDALLWVMNALRP